MNRNLLKSLVFMLFLGMLPVQATAAVDAGLQSVEPMIEQLVAVGENTHPVNRVELSAKAVCCASDSKSGCNHCSDNSCDSSGSCGSCSHCISALLAMMSQSSESEPSYMPLPFNFFQTAYQATEPRPPQT
ncbi:MAG: hypothetical protein RI563_09100 [Thiohalophilus sp.]|uniref:hypothetical protein n=1 Tax=Thiohalophilus sp. TaxID=3028392 RepID=UPI00287068D9|nr:hypothetical protein [Thiohalophilus sp.]MDR9437028.1 hypothetical protein [Thiohalophilus sp.]